MKAAASAGRRKSAYPGRSEPGAEPAMILLKGDVNNSHLIPSIAIIHLNTPKRVSLW